MSVLLGPRVPRPGHPCGGKVNTWLCSGPRSAVALASRSQPLVTTSLRDGPALAERVLCAWVCGLGFTGKAVGGRFYYPVYRGSRVILGRGPASCWPVAEAHPGSPGTV